MGLNSQVLALAVPLGDILPMLADLARVIVGGGQVGGMVAHD